MGWGALARDYERARGGRRITLLRLLGACLSDPGMLAVTLFRLQSRAHRHGRSHVANVLRTVNNALTGADFVTGARIAPGLLMRHPTGVVIGGGVVIGPDCTILQNVTLGERYVTGTSSHEYPRVEANVAVGAGAVVLGAAVVHIGAVVAANAVVLRSVPAGALVAGAPAQIIHVETHTRPN